MNESHETEEQPPVEVPREALSDELLTAVIESFVLREGTDYGAVEISLEAKISQVRRQLERGDIKLMFDPNTDSVTLMPTVVSPGSRHK